MSYELIVADKHPVTPTVTPRHGKFKGYSTVEDPGRVARLSTVLEDPPHPLDEKRALLAALDEANNLMLGE